MHWPIFDTNEGCVAHVFGLGEARLIASAPALLAALQELTDCIEAVKISESGNRVWMDTRDWCGGIKGYTIEARAALALATGGVK